MNELENLIQQKNDLLAKIREIDSEEILKGILEAIEKQRWYQFEGKPNVIFDSQTALLWQKEEKETTMNEKTPIPENIDGFAFWRFPTADEIYELYKMGCRPIAFKDRGGDGWHYTYYHKVIVSNEIKCFKIDRDTSLGGSTTINFERYYDNRIDVIFCSNTLIPHVNYSGTPQEVLNIFIKNNLVPKFDDADVNKLFAEYKARLKNPLVNIDYKKLMRKYDAAAVDKSAIKYSAAVAGVAEELLDALQEYEAAQAKTIAEFARLTENLSAPHAEFLLKRLDFGFDNARAQILSVKAQAENLAARLDKINHGEDSISRLAALETEPRASFEFLVENLAQIVLGVQRKVDFFAVNKNFVTALINTLENWGEDFLPVVEFALKGNLIDADDSPAAIRILSLLKEYKANADFDSEKFQQAIQEIISTRSKATEKIFLQDWLKTIFSA